MPSAAGANNARYSRGIPGSAPRSPNRPCTTVPLGLRAAESSVEIVSFSIMCADVTGLRTRAAGSVDFSGGRVSYTGSASRISSGRLTIAGRRVAKPRTAAFEPARSIIVNATKMVPPPIADRRYGLFADRSIQDSSQLASQKDTHHN